MNKERVYSLVQIAILLVSTIAFGWIIGGEVGFASAATESYTIKFNTNQEKVTSSTNKPTGGITSLNNGVYCSWDYATCYYKESSSVWSVKKDYTTGEYTLGDKIPEGEGNMDVFLGSVKEGSFSYKTPEELKKAGIIDNADKVVTNEDVATNWENTLSVMNFANIIAPILLTAVNLLVIQSGDYATEFKEAWSEMQTIIDSTAAANQGIRQLTEKMKNTKLAGQFNTAGTIITTAVIAITFAAEFSKKGKGYVIVEYECQPWQAPLNGDCDACNDGDLPCNLYKCKSLGQSCELLNEGVDGAEVCVDVNPKDVTPAVIRPNETLLTDGYVYSDYTSSPPSPGFIIESDQDIWEAERPNEMAPEGGAIKAFDPLTFAIDTEEYTQCKIDTDRDATFDEMFSYVGGSSLYKKTHIENLILPNQEEFNSSGIELSEGELELYIICEDKAGNQNEIPYTIRLTVDPTPDTTPPKVMASSILTDSCVANGQDNVSVSFFINEYVVGGEEDTGCRWDYTNNAYENMANEMDCSAKDGVDYLSICNTTFDGIKAAGTNYYVKCMDRAGNVMNEPEVFGVRSSSALALKITSPENNSDVYGSISTLQVNITAQTSFGCNSGLATCYYEEGSQWIEFAETDNENGLHSQELYLPDGSYTYNIKCIDGGGNIVSDSVDFNIETTSGVVVSNFEIEGTTLSFDTYAPSDCAYSTENCEFTFDEGTAIAPSNSIEHYFNYEESKTYYIKCMDEYNLEPADCTIKIRPDDVL